MVRSATADWHRLRGYGILAPDMTDRSTQSVVTGQTSIVPILSANLETSNNRGI